MATVILRPTALHWLNPEARDPQDLCAHSPVEFRIAGQSLVLPSDGDWSVNAAALYLLRTLTRSHTKESPVGDHLFPCCGFSLYDIDGEDDVVICGCPSGLDFQVIRRQEEVVLRSDDGQQHFVPFSDWKRAVCEFADVVRRFYDNEPPREPADVEDRKGFRKMIVEWDRRRALAET